MTPEEVKAWRKGERSRLIAARMALPVEQRRDARTRVRAMLAAEVPELRRAATIGFYWPFRGEVDLVGFVRGLDRRQRPGGAAGRGRQGPAARVLALGTRDGHAARRLGHPGPGHGRAGRARLPAGPAGRLRRGGLPARLRRRLLRPHDRRDATPAAGHRRRLRLPGSADHPAAALRPADGRRRHRGRDPLASPARTRRAAARPWPRPRTTRTSSRSSAARRPASCTSSRHRARTPAREPFSGLLILRA